MTFSLDPWRQHTAGWLLVLLLASMGCARLAPGIAPLAADPPASAIYALEQEDELTSQDTENTVVACVENCAEELCEDDDAVAVAAHEEAEPFIIDEGNEPMDALQAGALIPADDQNGERYIARQYPRTYPAPPPPSVSPQFGQPAPTTQPSSVYQLPPTYRPPSNSSAALQSPTYSPPNNTVPQSALPAPPAAALPPSLNGSVYQAPAGTLPPPITPIPAPVPTPVPMVPSAGMPSAGAPVAGTPAYGPPVYGPPITTTPAPQGLPPGPPSAAPDYGFADPLLGNPNDPYSGVPTAPPGYIPNTRSADLEITGYPARTGRLMFGGAVNSDAGVTGQITLDERNFDIMRFPKSFRDLASGTAFRGAGQTFRLEAVPGSEFKRYTASFADPNLLGYLPISFGVSGFLFDRRYEDWDEERLGGRVSFGYRVTPDLSLTAALNGQNVEVSNPTSTTVDELNEVLGDTQHYSADFRITHDTRNSPFQPSEGHFFEFGYEKAFGDFDYSRFEIENRNYLLLAERADGSGKQTLALTTRLGFSGEETPLYENYFAGGYSTMRGFDFRGASPVEDGVQVGGRFQWLNSLEYMFPITADDAFRGVAFVDFGTVERDIDLNRENFRVAPGVGLRISIPMLGPAPLAFDFAYPVEMADTDDRRIFSFYMSTLR